jgi:hypothetical protein
MKTMFRLLVAVLLLTGWSLVALSLHVVLAPGNPGRIALIPKQRLGITDTWADVRAWTVADLPNHPDLIARMIQNGKTDLLSHVVGDKDLQHALEDATHQAAEKPKSHDSFSTGG